MPVARFQMSDGRIGRFEVPEGTTPEQAQTLISAHVEQPKPQEPATVVAPKRDWADVPGEALSNAPKSAVEFGKGIYQAVRHPIDTIGNVGDMLAGGLRNALPESVSSAIDKLNVTPGMQEGSKRAVNTADAVGKFAKDRYGSGEGLKNTLATDPVGAAADLSAVLSGGATLASKLPVANAAKLASALKTAGEYSNPINVARKALSPIVSGAKNKMQGIEQKVATKAASDAASETASARSAAGNAAQNAYKQLEHLRELDAMGLLSAEQKLLAKSLSDELATKAAEKLTPAAALKQTTSDAYKESIKSEGARASKLAEEKLSGAEIKSQTMARLKRYGPAAAGGVLGNMLLPGLGGAVGGAATGLVLRPAIRSMGRLATNPAVQHKLLKPIVKSGDLAEALAPYGIPAFQAGRIEDILANDESKSKAEALAAILSSRQ